MDGTNAMMGTRALRSSGTRSWIPGLATLRELRTIRIDRTLRIALNPFWKSPPNPSRIQDANPVEESKSLGRKIHLIKSSPARITLALHHSNLPSLPKHHRNPKFLLPDRHLKLRPPRTLDHVPEQPPASSSRRLPAEGVSSRVAAPIR